MSSVICWLIFIVLYYLLITILFMLFSYPVYFHGSSIVCSHDICSCTFLHFTYSMGVSDSLNLYIQVYVFILMTSCLERITCLTRSRSSLTWSSFLGIFLTFSYWIHDSVYWTQCLFNPLFICDHCVRNLYVILQWLLS